ETGLLYVRREMLETIQAKYVGAYSDHGFDQATGAVALDPTARRYEYGTVSVPLRVGLHEAVKFVQRIGIERIWRRDRALSTRLVEGLLRIPGVELLSPRDPAMRSAMVTFKHARIPHTEVLRRLEVLKLRTRPVTEGGLAALRVSTHLYNSEEEVDRVLEGVRG
ncbi:MAG TPA: aminotransferase class V-fold PLP-dependent enzyme, partial [Bacteroidota bacterium]